ncbi:MAG: DNA primase DnaG [archaeon]|jgi:5S rRNA maturation endonuclease (ribonuclease M5)|nr:DNA primase DnaG [archaeon]
MAKIGVAAIKYMVRAKISTTGVVERPDVIGAVFGQTEGLLGEDLDLRELQKNGRIGRIEVELEIKDGKTTGKIEIPTSLSKENTALIAAGLETIERIGPSNSTITVEAIEDVRSSKRDYVVDRAKTLLEKLGAGVPESQELSSMVQTAIKTGEIRDYGPDKLAGGPDVESSDEIILVEGRADVLNLLKCGIGNCLSTGGTKVPESLKELTKGKKITAFLDGDRGGVLILKALKNLVDISAVSVAPNGTEVEEITQKEILKALRNQVPLDVFLGKERSPRKDDRRNGRGRDRDRRREDRPRPQIEISPEMEALNKLVTDDFRGSGDAFLLKQTGSKFKKVGSIPKGDLNEVVNNLSEGQFQGILVDGPLEQKMVTNASDKGINFIIGSIKPRFLKKKPGVLAMDYTFLRHIIEKNREKTGASSVSETPKKAEAERKTLKPKAVVKDKKTGKKSAVKKKGVKKSASKSKSKTA